MKKCPNCGKSFKDEFLNCPRCNYRLNTDYTLEEMMEISDAYKLMDRPEKVKNIYCTDERGKLTSIAFDVWTTSSTIVFCMTRDSIDKYFKSTGSYPQVVEIPLNKIEFYSIEGEEYIEQYVSGGNSGKVNIGGALVGGMLFGTAGAVILGSRKTNEIKTTNRHVDTRVLVLRYFDQENERRTAFFDKKGWDVLHDLLPQFEREVVIQINRNKVVQNTLGNNSAISIENNTSSSDIEARLDKLVKLKEKNLISQEEYEKKRNEILESL